MDASQSEEKPESHYLFVYGTLRKASESNAHKQYLRGADFVSPAKIRGKLFMVDYYPGLVLSDNEDWVIGEVYLIEQESQWHDLDVYEGCAKNSPQPHEYKRRITEVILNSGESLQTWAYVYLPNTDNLAAIESGDFLNPTQEFPRISPHKNRSLNLR